MRFFKTNIVISLSLLLLSFTMKDDGNKNGCINYNSGNVAGVFSVYKLTREFVFGQPSVTDKKYIAFLYQTAGDTTSKYFNGNLSFSNTSLIFTPQNYYTNDSAFHNGVGNNKWILNESGNQDFSYHFKRGFAEVTFDQNNKIEDTIRIQNGFSLNLNGMVDNADSILVTITSFNGHTIYKHGNGLLQGASFTPTELTNFISGGIISVSAINITPEAINSKNYLFCTVHHYLKLVYFKN